MSTCTRVWVPCTPSSFVTTTTLLGSWLTDTCHGTTTSCSTPPGRSSSPSCSISLTTVLSEHSFCCIWVFLLCSVPHRDFCKRIYSYLQWYYRDIVSVIFFLIFFLLLNVIGTFVRVYVLYLRYISSACPSEFC